MTTTAFTGTKQAATLIMQTSPTPPPAPEKAPWWNTWAYVAGGVLVAAAGVVAYNKHR